MYELINFGNHARSETYGRDAFGEFGTILAEDYDLAIPEADFQAYDQPVSVHNPTAEQP